MKNYNDDNNNNKLISGVMGNLMSSKFYCSIKVYLKLSEKVKSAKMKIK